MKSLAIVALFALFYTANANNKRHAHKRQPAPPPSSASTPRPSSASAPSPSSASAPSPSSATAPSAPAPAGTGVPPLTAISLGMPTQATLAPSTTYAAGATPSYSGAPPLPTPLAFDASKWPTQDKVPDTSSDEVKEWMKELDGFNIPNFKPTVDGTCANDAAAAADAANRGWWTCGGYTRTTDITACPDKLTWGVSFDDGPAPYTQNLLKFLSEKSLLATFFVVGSRVIERPAVLVEGKRKYMTGHEISVHTWSHKALTSLPNEQIVAELGWTRKAIKTVLGVTPTTMRPPFGDIDDRVRAISLAMGLVPIIWTRTPSGAQFDTNDWRVAGGLVNSSDSVNTFNQILGNATTLDTGFIMLEHDLYAQSVDLAIGYYLPTALTHNPPFTLKPIGQCSNIPTPNLYLESNKNTSFPYTNHTTGGSGSKSSAHSTTSTSTTLSSVLAIGLAVIGGCFL